MKRIISLICLIWLIVTPAVAQDPYRIHMILWRGETEVEQGFRAYMQSRQIPVEITVHNINRDRSLIPGILAEIEAAQPDLVYTWGTSIALATAGRQGEVDPNAHITDIPIVSTMVSAPKAVGLVPETGITGRNNTAVSHVPPVPTQVQAMKSYRPVRRIGVIFNPAEQNSLVNVESLRAATAAEGITLVEAPVPLNADGEASADVIPELVESLAAADVEFLYIGPDSFVGTHSVEITERAIAHNIPSFTATELEVRDASAMFGLVSRYEAVGALTGFQVEQVLVEGRDPGQLPMLTLERFTFLIRRDVMQRLKLYPPMQILRYAVVIE
jgi:putative ABC transport system substrate-binding protein